MGASMTEASGQHPSVRHLGFCVTTYDNRTSFVVTQNPNRAQPARLPGPAVCRGSGTLTDVQRDIVAVVGPDARGYLHGQVSQDVQSLAAGGSRWTLVLAPNGRVDVLARVLCVSDDRFELDTEAGFGDVLHERLNRFRIRVKAELERSTADLPAGTALVGWWGDGIWLADVDDYEAARVEAGWPAMGAEIVPGERIPAEVGVVPVTVDFTKGCYPGQELVERMDSRGSQAPRQLRIVSLNDAANPDAEITTVAGGKALAYVKRGVAVGEVPGPTTR
jgi:folate-binding protein YgfZ